MFYHGIKISLVRMNIVMSYYCVIICLLSIFRIFESDSTSPSVNLSEYKLGILNLTGLNPYTDYSADFRIQNGMGYSEWSPKSKRVKTLESGMFIRL